MIQPTIQSTASPDVGSDENTPSLPLLRFLTCGSVDDGKSTLIGRLLLEADAVQEDQLEALRRDSQRHGTTDAEIDPALLVDGLEDERAQGITIDVAYRYFQTPRRKFIIADSPGHEQYTRNMATAASTAEVAVLVVDAQKGVLTQTRRHAAIVSLLGVRQLVLAVNKMDLVNYDEAEFRRIDREFREATSRLGNFEQLSIPVSGLQGDNVARQSTHMPWYEGPTLLDVLETTTQPTSTARLPFRFPVQRVSRPDAQFRGYSGTVASGSVRVGDAVQIMPSGKASRVRSIVTFLGHLPEAQQGTAVTLTLEDEIDVSRGDWIIHPGQLPQVGQHLEATLVWMSTETLVTGKTYWLKHTTRHTAAEVEDVVSQLDIHTLHPREAQTLKLNDIGRCRIRLHQPIAYEPYTANRKTGTFILVDRVTHETVAGGMILSSHEDEGSTERAIRPGLQYTPSSISREARCGRTGHDPATVLITGLSGAGKTSLAFALEARLFSAGLSVTVLDGQNLRHGISRELGFSAEERSENLRRAAEIARLLNDAGLICLAAFVAPEEAVRAKARDVIGSERFFHVHLDAPLETCRQRDSAGRYTAAERGEIANFPGVTAPYPTPQDADLVIPTDRWPLERCVAEVERWLLARCRPS